MKSSGMTMDEPAGIALKPSETRGLLRTFPRQALASRQLRVSGHCAVWDDDDDDDGGIGPEV
jgi:hypothetical protein